MTTTRRAAIAAIAGLATLACGPVLAQSWPQRPVTFIVPFPGGGGTDAFARPLAAALDPLLGQRVIIENRGGAGGTVGATAASKAAPDGYTFFVGAAHHAIAPALYPKLEYNIETDFIPIALVAVPPQVVVVNPKVPANSLAELIDYARKNPDKLNYASAGAGTTHHLAGELFQLQTKTKLTHVPYRGAGPALQDVVAGQVDLLFDGLGSSAPQIQTERLRGLAVAAATRSDAIPNVPTAREAGLDQFEVATWYALFAVKGTPPDVVARMRSEVGKALKTQMIVDAWKKNGSPIPDMAGEQLGQFVKAEVVRWGTVVKDAQVKLD
ncbi:tripartite tricarboxylate transporter substrate-binding protein [Bosea sp. (in: a-proteobacteria)]|uniref:Bug family tripartite tricarboxylate transporter substrate binding protein n=1 Tax=Bosea sp. (in: a-proteobacteria) TaxID=1871050 RepID=UPI0012278BAE|nr:tripartite tricarboxylate transporter substrate-binding protein [Bosea sp. (in: a-proteobacteria)]TAJ31067.1 MAG: tripartite tricarboxylate transporter substrate binding protein [Bosea sp. (in: a-proteobacteria)]